MSHAQAAHLRRRATRLRGLASTIERAQAMVLDRYAGLDTWRGQRPQLCRNLLLTNQAQLHSEAEQLRWQAYLFERRAAELEVQAHLLAGRVS